MPAPPKLLDDVGVWLLHARGSRSEEIYTVGSITADRYLTVPGSKLPAVRAFMQQLNGRRLWKRYKMSMIRENGLQTDVAALHRKFRRAGLLAATRRWARRRHPGDVDYIRAAADRPVTRLVPATLPPWRLRWVFLGATLIVAALVSASYRALFFCD